MNPENEAFSSFSAWEWLWDAAGTAVLVYSLGLSTVAHAKRIWENPCRACTFWSRQFQVKEFKGCTEPYWVARGVSSLHHLRTSQDGRQALGIRVGSPASRSTSPEALPPLTCEKGNARTVTALQLREACFSMRELGTTARPCPLGA